MVSNTRRRCKNCRFWFAPGLFRQRGEGDCINPKMGQLVMCLSMAHEDHPDEYPHINTVAREQFRTHGEFGCVLYEE